MDKLEYRHLSLSLFLCMCIISTCPVTKKFFMTSWIVSTSQWAFLGLFPLLELTPPYYLSLGYCWIKPSNHIVRPSCHVVRLSHNDESVPWAMLHVVGSCFHAMLLIIASRHIASRHVFKTYMLDWPFMSYLWRVWYCACLVIGHCFPAEKAWMLSAFFM